MALVLLISAIAIPVLAAEMLKTPAPTIAMATQVASAKINCTIPENAGKINETLEKAELCFKDIVLSEIGLINSSFPRLCVSVRDFNSTAIAKYLNATRECETRKQGRHSELSDNLHKFANVVNITLSGGHYKDFYLNKGVQCVTQKRLKIQECVRNKTQRSSIELHPQLYLSGFVDLQLNQGCGDVMKIKDCIAKEFLKSPENCTENSSKFTNFLFDTTHAEFCKQQNQMHSSCSNVMGTPIPIVIALIVLSFILSLY